MTARAKCNKCNTVGPVNWNRVDGKDVFECADLSQCKHNKAWDQDAIIRQIIEICAKDTNYTCHGVITIKDGKLTAELNSPFFEGFARETTF